MLASSRDAIARPAGARRGICPAENEGTQSIHEIRSQAIVLDQKSHVDRAVEGIEDQIQIDISAELATAHTAFQSSVGLVTARPQEAVAEGGDEILVALAGCQNRGDDAPSAAAKHLDQLTHLAAHIGVHGAGIGKMKATGNAVREGVCDESTFVGPPAVHRGFSNLGTFGDFFDGEVGESCFAQEFQSSLQYGESGFLTTGTAGRTLSVSVFAV